MGWKMRPTPNTPPSPRQLQILRACVRGGSYQRAAEQLGISESTVKNSLAALYRKLGVGNRTEAAVKAVRLGLIEPDDLQM
jgi:DNA-binding NarL/FixJ family response regulator